MITKMTKDYNDRLVKIYEDPQYRNWTDFAVVYDPGMSQMHVKDSPIEGVSDDCFHPSFSAHGRLAIDLW
jgi:hypothetical protein